MRNPVPLLLPPWLLACAPADAPSFGGSTATGAGAEQDAEPSLGGGTLLEGPPGVPEAPLGRLCDATLC